MALLLNRYPSKFIEKQFNNVLAKFKIDQPLNYNNYQNYRNKVIESPFKERLQINYEKHCSCTSHNVQV